MYCRQYIIIFVRFLILKGVCGDIFEMKKVGMREKMVIIRNMQESDIEMVANIEAAAFSQPWSANGFRDALHMGNAIFLVAEENKKILGYIGMYISLDEAEITNVAVEVSERRRGIGRMLLDEMKKEAEQHGITRIVLEVRVSNQNAIHLYERGGFVDCGIRRGFYQFPKEDACIMVYGQ